MEFCDWFSFRHQAVKTVAEKMLLAAQTAPKGRGEDNLVLGLLEGSAVTDLAKYLKDMSNKYQVASFARDADNLLKAEILVLIGTKIKTLGLKKCGLCGFDSCAEKEGEAKVPCAFNTGDLGIAVGSAVSVAMDHRVDNRIMYSVGLAAIELKLMGEDVKIAYGIPLSATGKNPFFDRK